MLIQRGKPYRLVTFLLLCLAVAVPARPQKKFPYEKADMPFNAPAVERPIDRDCADGGTGSGDHQQAQNRAKNDFGAQGTPVPVTITDFDRLERASLRARVCAQKPQGNCRPLKLDSKMLPADRDQLKDIARTAGGATVGEGTVVVLEAKLLDSHYSNTKYNVYGFKNDKPERGGGESVNCKGVPSADASAAVNRNDIHIVLAAPGVKSHCLSVTAEISPHFRPDSWRRFHNMGENQLGEDVNEEARGVDFKKIELVRITGPLFYDASHEPCTDKKRASPARRSIWEIHPVHKLEVKSNGKWVSFDEWAKKH